MSLKIVIDKLSGHDQEGVIGKIYKSAGDEIVEGDLLFTIESEPTATTAFAFCLPTPCRKCRLTVCKSL